MAIPEVFLKVKNGRELFLRRGWIAQIHYLLERDPDEKIYHIHEIFRKNKRVIAGLYGALYVEPSSISSLIIALNNKVQFRETLLKLPELPIRTVKKEDYDDIGKVLWTGETINTIFSDGKLPSITTRDQQIESTVFYEKLWLLVFITGAISFYSIWRAP